MEVSHEVYQRDDGWFDVMRGEAAAGPFPTITFAMRIASGHPPAPAQLPKFRQRRIIREVRDASA